MIRFFNEDTNYRPRNIRRLRAWIDHVIRLENKMPRDCVFIFCSDKVLLKLNRQYLKRDTLTDVIAFDMSERPEEVSGDIYISIDRVRENARKFSQRVEKEIHRVMVHGVLHLIGYNDSSQELKAQMRNLEDHYLVLLERI